MTILSLQHGIYWSWPLLTYCSLSCCTVYEDNVVDNGIFNFLNMSSICCSHLVLIYPVLCRNCEDKIVLWPFYLFNELSHRDQHFSIYTLNQVCTYLPCWILLHSKNSQCEKMVLRLSYLHKVISYIPVKLNLYSEVSPSLLTLPHSMQEFPMWK